MHNYKKLMAAKSEKWLAVKNLENDTAEVRIDGVIGGGWDSEDKTAADFIRELNGITASQINLHINSPGGDVFHGIAMYHALVAVKKSKRVCGYVDGVAASIASVVLMAADDIVMPESSFLMIHDPWTFGVGNAREFRACADDLDGIGATIAKIYSDRSSVDIDKIKELMHGRDGADGTFLTAASCLELGLCTEVRENIKAAACIGIDVFDDLPDPLRRIGNAMNKRDLEDALRDAGYSASEAKRIASGGAFRRDGEGCGDDDVDWDLVKKQLERESK